MKINPKGEIVIFKPKGAKAGISVRLKKDTVWLSLMEMVELFQRDKSVISRHINNAYKEGELSRKATVAKYATVQKEGKRKISRDIEYYNLDVIISAGYRVKSKRGTQFRIWATQVLKNHIIQGYSINERRLKEQNESLLELQRTANLMGRLLESRKLKKDETAGLLKIITDYSYALTVLDQYDRHKLKITGTTSKEGFVLTYAKAKRAIDKLRDELKSKGEKLGLFGLEKDASFRSSIGAIYQTFDGKDLYLSIEERAAHLLYFVVKNHSFTDGNKRIGAFLFVWFLGENNILYTSTGQKRIGDNALVALTLMIAQSQPKDINIIVKVIVNLINKNN